MTLGTKSRLQFGQKLKAADWPVQDMKQLNFGAGQPFVVRQYPADIGPADYVCL